MDVVILVINYKSTFLFIKQYQNKPLSVLYLWSININLQLISTKKLLQQYLCIQIYLVETVLINEHYSVLCHQMNLQL